MKIKGYQVSIMLLLTILTTMVMGPAAQAATSVGAGTIQVVASTESDKKVESDEETEGDVEAQYAHIIRGVLLAASAVWRMPWFQNIVVNGVRRFSSSPAATAVQNSWNSLGRTVDNLIGTPTLTWTVVRENFTRTLSNEGYHKVATQAGVALEQVFRDLVRFFN